MKYVIKRIDNYGLFVKRQNNDGWFDDTGVLAEAKQFDSIADAIDSIQQRIKKNPPFDGRFTIVGIRPMASVVTYEEVTL